MSETLKQCVDRAVADGCGADAILRAARGWMIQEKLAARVIPEEQDIPACLSPAPQPRERKGRQ